MKASESSLLRQLLCSDSHPGNVVALASGFNSVTKPSGADVVLIVPLPDDAITITLKGVTGDTGLVIASATDRAPTLLNVTGSAIGLTVSDDTTATIVWASRNGRLVGA
jgi:hypothetical protein